MLTSSALLHFAHLQDSLRSKTKKESIVLYGMYLYDVLIQLN